MKKDIKQFVAAIIDKNYKQANDYLKSGVYQKIKQRIINNNTNLF